MMSTDRVMLQFIRAVRLSQVNSLLARGYSAPKIMDGGGNGGGLPLNNKQRTMLPNKGKGEFTRNPRKDSEVGEEKFAMNATFLPADEAFSAAAVTPKLANVALSG